MESLADYGNSVVNNFTTAHHFLQQIKSTELEAAVNVFQAQPKQYGKDFDETVSYLGQVVARKGYNIQSVGIAQTSSQLI